MIIVIIITIITYSQRRQAYWAKEALTYRMLKESLRISEIYLTQLLKLYAECDI